MKNILRELLDDLLQATRPEHVLEAVLAAQNDCELLCVGLDNLADELETDVTRWEADGDAQDDDARFGVEEFTNQLKDAVEDFVFNQ